MYHITKIVCVWGISISISRGFDLHLMVSVLSALVLSEVSDFLVL